MVHLKVHIFQKVTVTEDPDHHSWSWASMKMKWSIDKNVVEAWDEPLKSVSLFLQSWGWWWWWWWSGTFLLHKITLSCSDERSGYLKKTWVLGLHSSGLFQLFQASYIKLKLLLCSVLFTHVVLLFSVTVLHARHASKYQSLWFYSFCSLLKQCENVKNGTNCSSLVPQIFSKRLCKQHTCHYLSL